jgi:hypothetical protein
MQARLEVAASLALHYVDVAVGAGDDLPDRVPPGRLTPRDTDVPAGLAERERLWLFITALEDDDHVAAQADKDPPDEQPRPAR